MKVYLSGKMQGIEKDVYEKAFKEVEKILTAQGWEVINPCNNLWNKAEHSHEGKAAGEILMKDLKQLSECDAIYMLDNWKEDSDGCRVEYHFAKKIGLKILNAKDDGPLQEFLKGYEPSGDTKDIRFLTTMDISYILRDMAAYTLPSIAKYMQFRGFRSKVIDDKLYWVLYSVTAPNN